MGKVRDWIMEHVVGKEINNLLEERKGNFKPLDYFIDIIEKIDISNFNAEFTKFKARYPVEGHNDPQIGRLNLIQLKVREDSFSKIEEWDSTDHLKFYDNNTCFMYYFTIQKTLDTNDTKFQTKKDNFLKDDNGMFINDIQYKEIPVKGTSKVTYERLMYIGITTNISARFNGHKVFKIFHQPRFRNVKKYLYISEITLNEEIPFKDKVWQSNNEIIQTPLDVISPYALAENILLYLENIFITYFDKPELNDSSFHFKKGTADLWNEIFFPTTIKIEAYKNSIFFNESTFLNFSDTIHVISKMPESQKEFYKKKVQRIKK